MFHNQLFQKFRHVQSPNPWSRFDRQALTGVIVNYRQASLCCRQYRDMSRFCVYDAELLGTCAVGRRATPRLLDLFVLIAPGAFCYCPGSTIVLAACQPSSTELVGEKC